MGTSSQSSIESNLDDEDSNDKSSYATKDFEQNELLDGMVNAEIILREEEWKAYRKTILEEEYNQSDSNSEMEELINEIAVNIKF